MPPPIPQRVLVDLRAFHAHVESCFHLRREHFGSATSDLLIRVAESIAIEIQHASGVVDPLRAAEMLGIHVRFVGGSTGSGTIVPKNGGFEARVAGSPEHAYVRFSIAHECGHACFFSLGSPSPQRVIPPSYSLMSSRADREEHLCDLFARTLLLPTFGLPSDRAISKLTLCDVDELAASARVPFEAAVRRLVVDEKWGDESIWYRVTANDGIPDVRTLRRGGLRPRTDSTAPVQNELETFLVQSAPIRSRERLVDLVRDRFRARDVEAVNTGLVVWLRMGVAAEETRQPPRSAASNG